MLTPFFDKARVSCNISFNLYLIGWISCEYAQVGTATLPISVLDIGRVVVPTLANSQDVLEVLKSLFE